MIDELWNNSAHYLTRYSDLVIEFQDCRLPVNLKFRPKTATFEVRQPWINMGILPLMEKRGDACGAMSY